MRRQESGFTLIELMIVVVIIGTLASIAIPNFIAMQSRAKEAATKANMHTFQLASEDYGIQNNAQYAGTANQIAAVLPSNGATFKNPFTNTQGAGVSWEDRATFAADPSGVSGIVSYADSLNSAYNIKGVGYAILGVQFPLPIILTSGQ